MSLVEILRETTPMCMDLCRKVDDYAARIRRNTFEQRIQDFETKSHTEMQYKLWQIWSHTGNDNIYNDIWETQAFEDSFVSMYRIVNNRPAPRERTEYDDTIEKYIEKKGIVDDIIWE